MIVGHYGVSFAIKSLRKDVPLWVLFVAVQVLDFLWLTFVSLNIEQSSIDPKLGSMPLVFEHMPYSHSLLGALVWSGITFAVYKFIPFGRHTIAARMVALAVLSHWLLDIFVHRPDLALYDDAYKIGLSGWDNPSWNFFSKGLACSPASSFIFVQPLHGRSLASMPSPPMESGSWAFRRRSYSV